MKKTYKSDILAAIQEFDANLQQAWLLVSEAVVVQYEFSHASDVPIRLIHNARVAGQEFIAAVDVQSVVT
jgi:hypothetical protein